MIDEKKLIEELEKRAKGHEEDAEKSKYENFSYDIDELLLRLADEVDAIIEVINEQPKVGEWITCSERLPKETDFPEQKYRILASCSDGIVRNATIENLRDRSKKHFNSCQCEFTYLAWQPLPKPYKE